jgi:PAS domain S-box-containing protein
MEVPPSAWCLPQAVLEHAAEAIVFADRSGRVQLWNRGAEVLFGYTRPEALGRSLDTLIIPEPYRRAHNEAYDRAMASGQLRAEAKVRTTRAVDKFGGRLYLDISFSLVKDPDGNVVGSVAIGRDVTSAFLEKQAARERARAAAGPA